LDGLACLGHLWRPHAFIVKAVPEEPLCDMVETRLSVEVWREKSLGGGFRLRGGTFMGIAGVEKTGRGVVSGES